MPKQNKREDVFKFIDFAEGDKDKCWLWAGHVDDGRPYFNYLETRAGHGKKRTRKMLAYRIVWELVFGKTLHTHEVMRHKCDVPICCNPFHLVKGSHQENMNDMKERERHGLPHHTVRAIRKLCELGRTDGQIAELYGIGVSTVADIRKFNTYKNVE